MPKLENTRNTLPHLDSAIKSIRQQCFEFKLEREHFEKRVRFVMSELDAILKNFNMTNSDTLNNDYDSSGASTSQPTSNSSLSIESLDSAAAAAAAPPPRNKPRSVTDLDLCIPNIQESGVCMVPASSMNQSMVPLPISPVSVGQQKKVPGVVEELKPLASSSFRIPPSQTLNMNATRNRSYSQQSLPESVVQNSLMATSSLSIINKFKNTPATNSSNNLNAVTLSNGKAKATERSNSTRLLSRLVFSSSSPVLNNKEIAASINILSSSPNLRNTTIATSTVDAPPSSSSSSDNILEMSKTCTEL